MLGKVEGILEGQLPPDMTWPSAVETPQMAVYPDTPAPGSAQQAEETAADVLVALSSGAQTTVADGTNKVLPLCMFSSK
jgi:hypothetical protein